MHGCPAWPRAAASRCAGWLGGFQNQDDHATLSASFFDASHASLGSVSIGLVLAQDDLSGLLLRSRTGTLPTGTAQVLITLDFGRINGSDNDVTPTARLPGAGSAGARAGRRRPVADRAGTAGHDRPPPPLTAGGPRAGRHLGQSAGHGA